MSTPRATQQGLGSATTLKGRPSTINTGYLAEGIDKIGDAYSKSLADKALSLERDRIKTEKVLSQKSDLKFSANQKEYADWLKGFTGSKEFAFLNAGEALNKSQEKYLELKAQERVVLSDIEAKAKAGFEVYDENEGIYIPLTEKTIAEMENKGVGNFEGYRVVQEGFLTERGKLNITDPNSELTKRLKDFQNVTKNKGADVEGGFIVNKETFSQADADKFVNNIMQDPDFIMSYADKYRAMQGGKGRRDDYIPTQEFQDYMRGEVEGIAREKVDVTSIRQLRTDKDETPIEGGFGTAEKVIDSGDGLVKKVLQTGLEEQVTVPHKGKATTITAVTEDGNNNMVLVGQYEEDGELKRTVITNSNDVKDAIPKNVWEGIINTYKKEVQGKSEETFDIDTWMNKRASDFWFSSDESFEGIRKLYPEISNVSDPTNNKDIKFTYKGEEYSYDFKKGSKDREDFKKLLNKIEKERGGETTPTQTETTIQTTKKPR